MILKKQWDTLASYRQIIGDDYYSFEHEDYTFIVINTQFWQTPHPEETPKHDAWLQQQLATALKRHRRIVVVGHHPPFFNQPDEGRGYHSVPPAKRKEVLALFDQFGVEAVLTGHTHRLRVHERAGVQYVSGESTCNNIDGRPLGFRLWTLEEGKKPTHRFVPLYRRANIDPKPPYDPGREQGEAGVCMANLRLLDAAKERYGMQQGLASGASVPPDLLAEAFPETAVACPAGGIYTPGALGVDPSCSMAAHHLPYTYQLEEFQRRAKDAGAGASKTH